MCHGRQRKLRLTLISRNERRTVGLVLEGAKSGWLAGRGRRPSARAKVKAEAANESSKGRRQRLNVDNVKKCNSRKAEDAAAVIRGGEKRVVVVVRFE